MSSTLPTKQDFYNAKEDLMTVDAVSNSKDPISGAEIDSYMTRRGGQTDTLAGRIKKLGFFPAGFDFSTGGVLQSTDRDKAVYHLASTTWYSWGGALPKQVVPGTDPTSELGWVPRTDPTIKSWVAQLYSESPYIKTEYQFSMSAPAHQVTSSRQVVKNTVNGMWYKYTGVLPVAVPASPTAGWVCVGALNGFALGDARNFKIDTNPENITLWMSCGEAELTGLGGTSVQITNSVTIPAGVIVRNTTFEFSGPGNNIVLLNSNSEFYGTIIGTGTLNKVERAFYPAADGVENAHIDADIYDVTFGCHAQPISPSGAMPKGWTGVIRAKKIVGAVGASEGYGLLMSPATGFNMEVIGDDVARHVVYLSAGAYANNIIAWANKCGNVAAQLYSTAGQPATRDNELQIWLGNIYNPAGQSGQAIGVAVLGNVVGNNITVSRATGGDKLVKVEGDVANSLYPNGNTFNLPYVSGTYTSGDVCTAVDARGTVFNIGMWFAKATFAGIAFRKTTSSESSEFVTGEVNALNMSMAGSNNVGVYGDTGLTVKLGWMNISNDGTAAKVNVDNSRRIGYTRRYTGTYQVSVAGTSQASQSISLPFQPKLISYSIVGFSAANTPASAWVDNALSPALTKTLYVYNPSSSSQTITVQIAIEGD